MTLTIDDLRTAGLGEQCAAIEDAIAAARNGRSPNVAVISEPFAGREVLLDYAEDLLDGSVERRRFDGVVAGDEVPALPDVPAMILDDCHYLYRREIGGFDALTDLLERLAMSDTLVVASWNRYAWRYLAAVRDVDDSFPVEIEIPSLSTEQIEALVTANYDRPSFVDTGAAGRIKTVTVDRQSVRLWGSRTLTVPLVRPNPAWVRSWWTRDDEASLEAVVYEKLRRVANGNPGLVTRFWEDSIENDEIAPANVHDPVTDVSLDEASAGLLLRVVSKESVPRSLLADTTGDTPVDTTLQKLRARGIVAVQDEHVSITPEGLHTVVDHLDRRRLLW